MRPSRSKGNWRNPYCKTWPCRCVKVLERDEAGTDISGEVERRWLLMSVNQSRPDVLMPLAILQGAVVGAVIGLGQGKLGPPMELTAPQNSKPKSWADARTRSSTRAAANRALAAAANRRGGRHTVIRKRRGPPVGPVRGVRNPKKRVEPTGKSRRWHEDKSLALPATYTVPTRRG